MLTKTIFLFGNREVHACDANCRKAWGINNRPKIQLSEDEDDTIYLADHELGDAPNDPGTYEGGYAKPIGDDSKGNKWCVRECERGGIFEPGQNIVLRDFSARIRNMPLPT